MSLESSRATLKASLLGLANSEDHEKTPEEAIDEFLDALEAWIKDATVTVPGTGLVAGANPVTGTATGNLS